VIQEMFRVDGKVALVTGAGRGIGRASALALAESGADVVVVSRTLEQVQEVADEIEAMGRRAVAVSADVVELERLGELVDVAVEQLGGLDREGGSKIFWGVELLPIPLGCEDSQQLTKLS
jgi:7-alpha-hydroxysteroid dehydrogenase